MVSKWVDRILWAIVAIVLTMFIMDVCSVYAQQPQAQGGQPLMLQNVQYVGGVGIGYWATAGSGLTLNVTAGTCWTGSVFADYAGGTVTLTASSTNYVYVNTSTCAPTVSVSPLFPGIATVLTGADSITAITDTRTWFAPLSSGGSMTYPPAGVGNSSGTAWLASYGVGATANDLVQLNSSGQLPAVSAANLIDFPTLNQDTTGTAANITGTVAVANGGTGNTSLTAHSLLIGEGTAPVGAPGDAATVNLPLLSQGVDYDPSYGQLNLGGAGVTGTVAVANGGTGNTSGLAALATALAATPSQCSGAEFATGIAANGNANCGTPSGLPSSWSVNGTNNAVMAQPLSGQDATALTIAPNDGGLGSSDIFDVCSTVPCSSGTKYFGVEANGNTYLYGNQLTLGAINQANPSWLNLPGGIGVEPDVELQTGALAPPPPVASSNITQASGGSLTAGNEYAIEWTCLSGVGETTVSTITDVTLGAGDTEMSGPAPACGPGSVTYNIYMQDVTEEENWYLNNGTPIADGTAWTISSYSSNLPRPTSNTSGAFAKAFLSMSAEGGGVLCSSASAPSSDCAPGTILPLISSGTISPNGCAYWVTTTSLGSQACGGGGGGSAWSGLTSAAGNLTLENLSYSTTFNQSTAAVWTWANVTAATSTASQESPIQELCGTYWTGSASAPDCWTLNESPLNGTDGSSVLAIGHNGSSGVYQTVSVAASIQIVPSFPLSRPALLVKQASGETSDLLDLDQTGSVNVFQVTHAGAATATNVTDTALTSGDCVQAGAGGLLTVTGSGCGSSSVTLETNGTDNATQGALNLASGTGIALSNSGSTVTVALATVAPGDASFTVGTTAIASNSCTSAATVTMTGVTTSMAFSITPAADVSGVTGWGAVGGLTIDAWPTAGEMNYKVCNQTAASITPSASVTFNVSAR